MPSTFTGRVTFALIVFVLLSLIARNVYHRVQSRVQPEASMTAQMAELQRCRNPKQVASDSPLYLAAQQGDVNRVYALLAHGADPNGQDVVGRTPLMNSIAYAPSAAKVLLEHGANPNFVDTSRRSPLYTATLAGQTETVRLLLKHGADATLPVTSGHSMLYYARKHKDAEIIALIQQAGARE